MNRRLRAALPVSSRAALPLLALCVAAAVALSFLPVSAADLCGDEEWGSHTDFGGGHGKVVTDIQESHLPAPSGTWRIDAGENGAVHLSDWDKDEVLICARVTAWSRDKDRAESLLRSIHVESDGGRLHAEGPAQSDAARWSVSYRIRAPRAIDLNVEAVNGGIAVAGIHGRMSLRTENGPIELDGAGGDIEGRTTNGPVSVTLSGSRWSGKGLDVETANGPVELAIPEHYSAELITGTENGPVASAYAGVSVGRHRHVSTVIGSGGATIRVVTTNGPVTVREEE